MLRRLCYVWAVTPAPDPAETVARYVRSLRARATALLAVRATCAALGAAALLLVVAGVLAGPIVTPLLARSVLILLSLASCGLLAAGLRPVGALRGLGSCTLLAAREPVLASRVRSALELRANSGASADLVDAHARGVRDALGVLPIAEVLPLNSLRHPMIAGGLGAALVSGLMLLSSRPAQIGVLALLSPVRERADGVRVAPVIAHTSARLVYPSYLAMPASEIANPTAIQAPRGTTVEYTLAPLIASHQGELMVGASRVRMSTAQDGRLFARFVVRDSGKLTLRIESDGHLYEDSAKRSVQALVDQKPTATLGAPPGSETLEVQDRVTLSFSATDDHGLSVMELVARGQDGTEQRRRLWSAFASDRSPGKTGATAATQVNDEVVVAPAEFGALPGDVLMIWLEARDADVVSGPNIGVSKAVSFEIASDARKLSQRLPLLRKVLDGVLDALADRLENPLPDALAAARLRVHELRDVNDAWLEDLQKLIDEARRHDAESGLNVGQLQAVLDRMRRELEREHSIYQTGTPSGGALREVDARVVTGHERDVLLLADMLAQGLVDEAKGITQELADLKEHMRELLKQITTANSPEAQRELLAEIAKAQRRLRDLAQSLARLANRVPSEFINREALPQNDATSTLDGLRAAVEAGDMEAAQRELEALSREIDSLQEQVNSGGAKFREAHYGAQDKALDAARREISMLSAEQERLAGRTRELVKDAADRAQSRFGKGAATGAMQQQAERVDQEIEAMGQSSHGGPESQALERAGARMHDAVDALRTGDMAEARRMSGAAASSLGQAASSLEQDARMFPGPEGETARRARSAGATANRLDQLQHQIEQATPKLDEFVGEAERAALRGDAKPQHEAAGKAQALQSKLGGESADGPPLSPDTAQDLQQTADAMRRAENALQRGDPQSASLAQDDASERLRQIDARLAKQQGKGQGQNPGGQRGEQEGANGGNGARAEGKVRIHGADEFKGPAQMRRRLLDAMREPAPESFKAAVERYYEELLQ
jgi:hypothetical protein